MKINNQVRVVCLESTSLRQSKSIFAYNILLRALVALIFLQSFFFYHLRPAVAIDYLASCGSEPARNQYNLPDSDRDLTPDVNDGCPEDPSKVYPGICGCGAGDSDHDFDGVADCLDQCSDDANKIIEGICGCGILDSDQDGDCIVDCIDACIDDPEKDLPGICGCGFSDADSDGDGSVDCVDICAEDSAKINPGLCGCGIPDSDRDQDGSVDCEDGCPMDPIKTDAGICGCGSPDRDSDEDGSLNCEDACPFDSAKIAPESCGCGVPDEDSDGDGVIDCEQKTICDVEEDSDQDGYPDGNDPCPKQTFSAAPECEPVTDAERQRIQEEVNSTVESLRNSDPEVRRSGARYANQVIPNYDGQLTEEQRAQLRTALEGALASSSDIETRKNVVFALGNLFKPSKSTAALLFSIASSASEANAVRLAALDALSQFTFEVPREFEEYGSKLLEMLEVVDDNPSIQNATLGAIAKNPALGKSKEVVDKLEYLLHDSSPDVRIKAALALAAIGEISADGISRLKEIAEKNGSEDEERNTSEAERQAAIEALQKSIYSDGSVTEILAAISKDSSQSFSVRRQALRAIQEIRGRLISDDVILAIQDGMNNKSLRSATLETVVILVFSSNAAVPKIALKIIEVISILKNDDPDYDRCLNLVGTIVTFNPQLGLQISDQIVELLKTDSNKGIDLSNELFSRMRDFSEKVRNNESLKPIYDELTKKFEQGVLLELQKIATNTADLELSKAAQSIINQWNGWKRSIGQ